MKPDLTTMAQDSMQGYERIIRRKTGLAGLDLGEIAGYRDLLFFLVWRDIKVRYKQTALGVLWVVLQPLLAMALFTIIFGRLAKMPSDGIPYPLFVYSGLLLWNFFSSAVSSSGNSLVANSNLITKVYFPRIVIPASATLAGILDFLISAFIFIGMCFVYKVSPNFPGAMLTPLLVLLVILVAMGCGMWLSALNVEYRDFQYVIPFLLQIWMFATPVIYPAALFPEKYRWVLALNPMCGIIEAFRALSIGVSPVNWNLLAISSTVALFLFSTGLLYFRKVERSFADVI